jgi:ssDNA-binding replication factor A large subunit
MDLNIGRYGSLRIDPEDVSINVDLESEEYIKQIGDLTPNQRNVTIQGKLVDNPEMREVNTSRGPTTVTTFTITDDTGEVRVSLWRDLGELVNELSAGEEVLLENVNVGDPFNEFMQINSGAFTKVKILKGNLD